MKVSELIEHLQALNQDLPVWLTVSDDPEHCYRNLERDHITLEEVCDWKEAEIQNHFLAVVIGHEVYFP